MDNWRRLLTVAVIMCLCLMLLFPSIVVAADATVSIGAPAEVGEGTDFTARINITEVINFDAANYDITYNPLVLEVTDVTSGVIGGTTIPVSIWALIPSGVQGKIRIIQNIPGIAGVSGSGYLAEIHFHVVGSAGSTSNITLSNGMLSDNTATEIPATWIGDSVDINTALNAEFSASPLEGAAGVTQFTFTNATSGGTPPYTYQWDFDNNGTVDSTATSPTHTYLSAGTYTVSLTTTDSLSNSDTETKSGYVIAYNLGDANKDGNINSLDITKVERIMMGLDDSTPGADANADGSTNALDITRIEILIMGA